MQAVVLWSTAKKRTRTSITTYRSMYSHQILIEADIMPNAVTIQINEACRRSVSFSRYGDVGTFAYIHSIRFSCTQGVEHYSRSIFPVKTSPLRMPHPQKHLIRLVQKSGKKQYSFWGSLNTSRKNFVILHINIRWICLPLQLEMVSEGVDLPWMKRESGENPEQYPLL